MIVIVDYGVGNLRSVQKAFEFCKAQVCVSDKPDEIAKAEKIVVPGVGAFDNAMHKLEKHGLVDVIKNKIHEGTPYLGLCLGLQLLFSKSQEGKPVRGLDIIKGEVRRLKGSLKIPHMGWNQVTFKKNSCPLFKGIKNDSYFYFVHSYFGVPEDKSWQYSSTVYGENFCSSLWKGNVFATQFHPEKSQADGLRVIKNFIDYQAQ